MKVSCNNCNTDISSMTNGYDLQCPHCLAELNAVGQVIEFPEGQGFEFTGEEYHEEE